MKYYQKCEDCYIVRIHVKIQLVPWCIPIQDNNNNHKNYQDNDSNDEIMNVT